MKLISHPVSALKGTIKVPGDKSISHRAAIMAALAEGQSTISNFLKSGDCLATLYALRHLGVEIDELDDGSIRVYGNGLHGLKPSGQVIYCGNSGTSMRLLMGVMAGQAFDSELDGDASLRRRPMSRVSVPLSEMGASVQTQEGHAPVRMHGNSKLKAIEYALPIPSAQLKSAILLAGLYAHGETVVTEPLATRDHTEKLFERFSYPIQVEDNTVRLTGLGEFKACDIDVPGDISSAAFFMVAATVVPGSDLLIEDVGVNPTRLGIVKVLEQMGAQIELVNLRYWGNEPVADIRVRSAELEGVDIPKSMIPSCIDELPVMLIAAACAKGQTRVEGADELRVKESDRIKSMVDGLQRIGVKIQEFPDGLIVNGGIIRASEIDTYGDHRIAMAFAMAGCVAEGAITIEPCSTIATSFPNFLATAEQAGLSIQSQN